jgi:hypothetical protein
VGAHHAHHDLADVDDERLAVLARHCCCGWRPGDGAGWAGSKLDTWAAAGGRVSARNAAAHTQPKPQALPRSSFAHTVVVSASMGLASCCTAVDALLLTHGWCAGVGAAFGCMRVLHCGVLPAPTEQLLHFPALAPRHIHGM